MKDVTIVGGGIVGLATALALDGGLEVAVLEAEDDVARHQTGHNSGVVHSGLYYTSGSEKARRCVEGRTALEVFCGEEGIPLERCGKVVVAVDDSESAALVELERRGRANGLAGLRLCSASELREREPAVRGVAALHVPETGIVDFAVVARAMAGRLRRRGIDIEPGRRVDGICQDGRSVVIETAGGEVRTRFLVNCAGLESDRVARLCGLAPDVAIVPFRGEYWEVDRARRSIVRSLVYPVPDPRFPFLGVHLHRRIDGGAEVGPNAMLALSRSDYDRRAIRWRDAFDVIRWPGAWLLGIRHARTGIVGAWRGRSRAAFAAAARRLVPDLRDSDLVARRAGIRAQAVDRFGRLVDDFRLVEAAGSLHVLNAPSPAATASLAIGREIARRVADQLRNG